MQKLLKDLNPAQRQAAITTKGPILMLAGAGSGKTKTLTYRIAYLLKTKTTTGEQILAVTFTNKAAEEIKSRLANLLGRDYQLPYLGTFHSIAVKILRREAHHLGYRRDFVICDQSDQISLIKVIEKHLGMDPKRLMPQTVLAMISSAKSELVTPADYTRLISSELMEAVAKIYHQYQLELKKANLFDFDDLITQTVELFSQKPEILRRYSNQFKYILIDEYQDTNYAQYQLVNMLASKHQNICVVGDDWQSIYAFRGANYQNILNFKKDYPRAKVIKLEQNYRSTQNILDAAHHVITKNLSRSQKRLWTKIKSKEKVKLVQLSSEISEAQFIIRTIEDLISQNPNLSFRDFAVLYRVNAQSRSLEEEFLKSQIPYQIVGSLRFYERKEIKDILAFLRFIAQPSDYISLARIVNLPPRGIGQKTLQKISSFRQSKDTSLLLAIRKTIDSGFLRPKIKESLSQFVQMIEELKAQSKSQTVNQLVNLTLERTGYLNYLDDQSIVSQGKIENLKELVSVAKTFDHLSLEDFLTEVSLISDIDEHLSEANSVTLMTLHNAKGLGFDTVFITGLEEGIFPHLRSFNDTAEMEEERRLMYVGMTRAKKRLFLTNTSSRLIYGLTQYNLPSRFLADIPPELVEKLVIESFNF